MSIPVFSVPGFINWAEKQDPDTRYSFLRAETCVLTQYFRSLGVERDKSGLCYGPVTISADNDWNRIAQGGPRTIGAALARAKEMVT